MYDAVNPEHKDSSIIKHIWNSVVRELEFEVVTRMISVLLFLDLLKSNPLKERQNLLSDRTKSLTKICPEKCEVPN